MYSSEFILRSIRPVHASAVAASAMIALACLDLNMTTIPSSDEEDRNSNSIKANNLFSSIRPFWRSQQVTPLVAPPTIYATKTNRREFLLPTTCNCDNGPIESSSTPRSTMPTTTTLSQPTQPATQPTSPLFQPLTRTTLLLYRLNLKSHSSLPTPRLLTPSDPLFSYPQLTRGIKQRQNDETRLHRLLSSPKAMEARETQDQSKMNTLLEEMNSLVYGKGVSPQDREDFLMRFGCTGYTSEILDYLVNYVGKDRGFVEVGAGNGQWARALTDFHGVDTDVDSLNHSSSSRLRNNNIRNNGKGWEFVLAYDNMQELPLSPQIYHGNTVPAKKYFYDNVRQCASHVDAVQGYPARGRVLLLVYPPPGPMALETVEAYANAHPENDTIVFVGEGLGGANADKEFFEYFLGMNGNDVAAKWKLKDQQPQLHQPQQQQEQNPNQKQKQTFQWAVVKVMDVLSSPGGKGFEKMFVLKKVACQTVK